MTPLDRLRQELTELGVIDKVSDTLNYVVQDYEEKSKQILKPAQTGVALTHVMHEVEKGVRSLQWRIQRREDFDALEKSVTHLDNLMYAGSNLMAREREDVEDSGNIIRNTKFMTEYRTKYHGIELTADTKEFQFKGSRRVLLSAMLHMATNALEWVQTSGRTDGKILIGSGIYKGTTPVFYVADNGPGFSIPPAEAVKPLISTKPSGFGLGLYYADEAAKLHDGELMFPPPDLFRLSEYNTVVAIALNEERLINGKTK